MSRSRTLALLALAGCAMAAAGCGGRRTAACFVVDASRSARELMPEFRRELRETVEQAADDGARVAAVAVKGDPRVEAHLVDADFADDAAADKAGERVGAVAAFLDDVQDAVDDATFDADNPTRGSGIIGGIDVVEEASDCETVVVLSDALERSDDVDLQTDAIATEADRHAIIARLRRADRLPALDGVRMRFPFGARQYRTGEVWRTRIRYVKPFWTELADAAGANDLGWHQ